MGAFKLFDTVKFGDVLAKLETDLDRRLTHMETVLIERLYARTKLDCWLRSKLGRNHLCHGVNITTVTNVLYAHPLDEQNIVWDVSGSVASRHEPSKALDGTSEGGNFESRM